MILNADKIKSVRPVLSGRIETLPGNGEKAIISRQYVARRWRRGAVFPCAILVVSFDVRTVFFGAHLREAEQLNARLMQKRSEGSAR